jgi:hypothetical protein
MSRFVFVVAALAACQSHDIVVGELQEIASIKAIYNPNLDILFVVDNSGSMADHQAQLAENFPLMMDRLSQLEGGLPNLHIGVVTSDMGTTGSNGLIGPAIGSPGAGGCAGIGDAGALRGSVAITDTFISDVSDGAGGRVVNYTGDLRDVFAGIAQVGNSGCGFEQHLAAMRGALDHPSNAGFLRPDANLAVIIIADEDDCSITDPVFFGPESAELGPLQSFRCARFGVRCDSSMMELGDKTDCVPDPDSVLVDPVQPFIDHLVALKGDPRMVMVAGVLGDPAPVAVQEGSLNGQEVAPLVLAPSCTFEGSQGPAVADPAVRLAAFLDGFPGRSTLTSICSNDLSTPLDTIGASAKKLQGDPCLDTSALADASPEPGVQPACEVLDVRDSAPDAPRSLPSCADAGGDCYELVADPIVCPDSADHLRITFRRNAVTDDLWTSVRCQLR